MFRRRERRSEELEDLIYDALWSGLEHAVLSAQKNDRDAQAFVRDYKEFYLGNKRPSLELSAKAGSYVSRALSIDATCLHGACYRWTAGFTAMFGAGSAVLAMTKNWWYALGAAAGTGVSGLWFWLNKKKSMRDAEQIQTAIAFKPDLFREYLQESKEYMGEVLWMYGSLSEEQLVENRPAPKQGRYRRSKV